MQGLFSALQAFREQYLFWLNLPHVRVVDIIEIIIIAFIIYQIMVWIKNTRAWTLFKGLAIIMVVVVLAAVFQMNTILWLAGKAVSVGLIALAVIFQPELRGALERIGRQNIFKGMFSSPDKKILRFSDKTIDELVKACYDMGADRTGALIVIEKDVMLAEYARTGITVDGLVTRQLLLNIFEKNTPLHDGAVIMRGDRIVSATCYLPLTDSSVIDKKLGTRHRAAIGISEVSDSLTIIVSEETGSVSVAFNGKLAADLSESELRQFLAEQQQSMGSVTSKLGKLKRRLKGDAEKDRQSDNQ